MRGFFAVGAEESASSMNLGNLIRSAHAFGSFVFLVKADYRCPHGALGHVGRPSTSCRSTISPRPRRCSCPAAVVWSAVELVDDAVDLPSFCHPLNAAYVFGPERSSLSPAMLARCHQVVRIPTVFCIDLAVARGRDDRVLSLGRFAPRPLHAGGPIEELPAHVHGPIRRFGPRHHGQKQGAARLARSFHWRGERLWCADFHPGSKRQGDQCDTCRAGP